VDRRACFELGNPTLRRLKPSLRRFQALPQRHNQRILVRLIELTEVWELGHPQLESSRPLSRCRGPPPHRRRTRRPSRTRDEQIRLFGDDGLLFKTPQSNRRESCCARWSTSHYIVRRDHG